MARINIEDFTKVLELTPVTPGNDNGDLAQHVVQAQPDFRYKLDEKVENLSFAKDGNDLHVQVPGKEVTVIKDFYAPVTGAYSANPVLIVKNDYNGEKFLDAENNRPEDIPLDACGGVIPVNPKPPLPPEPPQDEADPPAPPVEENTHANHMNIAADMDMSFSTIELPESHGPFPINEPPPFEVVTLNHLPREVDCPPPAPIAPIANDDNVTTSSNESVTIPVLVNDNDIDGIIVPSTIEIKSFPQNGSLSVDLNTGEITYNPAPEFFGNDSFSYCVKDDDGLESNEATVNIDVNAPPAAVNDFDGTLSNESVTTQVLNNDSDPDGTLNPATVSIGIGPFNGSVISNPDGTITYTPDTNFIGVDSYTYTVLDNDGKSSNTATVLIDVFNRPPVAEDNSASSNQDTPVVIDVLSNDSDPDGSIDSTSVVIETNPSNGSVSINPSNGEITYTPNAGYNGPDSFTYTVKDNLGLTSNEATVNITVKAAPVANDDTATTLEETPVVINVAANDTDNDNNLDPTTVTILSGPSKGTATVDTLTGKVTYTPDQDENGSDSFTYTVADLDGQVSNVATVNLTIKPAPVANDDNATTNEETPVVINVTSNDTDADFNIDPSTVMIIDGAANGAINVNNFGQITYSPVSGFNGTDTFTYTVSDADGQASNTATVTITVNAAPEIEIVPAFGIDDEGIHFEDGSATDIFNSVTITDPDSPNMESATIQITTNFEMFSDELSIPFGQDLHGISVSYNNQTGIMTLTGSATKEQYEEVIGSIQYETTSQDPTTFGALRTFEVTVNDGEQSSNTADGMFEVVSVNDRPGVTTGDTPSEYTHNDLPVTIDPMIEVEDIDSSELRSAKVEIGIGFATGDKLIFNDTPKISGTFLGKTLTLTGVATPQEYIDALKSVKFEASNVSDTTRSIEFSVTDNGDDQSEKLNLQDSNIAIAEVNVTAANSIVGTMSGDNIQGTNGNDTIIGLGGDDNIDAGEGNDLIIPGTGADTIDAGEGDDTIIGNIDFATLDAGTGFDTFVLDSSSLNLDLSTFNTSKIERINLDNNDNSLKIDKNDILDLSTDDAVIGDLGLLSNYLVVDGEATNSVSLDLSDNWSINTDVQFNGLDYNHYTNDANENLLIQQGINVDFN